jgi:hypothetical protein
MTLVEQVREITTLKGGRHPYQDAQIEIREVDPATCFPTSKYVTVDSLVMIGKLARELRSAGVDINHLDDIAPVDGTVIAPPLVEFDGQTDCIVDGLHRMFIARAKHERVQVIHIRNVDPAVPIIGMPVPWEMVRVVKVAPIAPADRRVLRQGIEDTSECLTTHYRDLSGLGSRGRRPSLGQHE